MLVRVPEAVNVSDAKLLRRYQILYPKPTQYQTASIALMAQELAAGGEAAEAIRQRLLVRMGDISQYMKALKQRFSVWYNRSHQRAGTLWNERFKSVLVEGRGNPLQTMAAYIDLNPVRAGLVQDPKDYRFCGYAEVLAEGARRLVACARFGRRMRMAVCVRTSRSPMLCKCIVALFLASAPAMLGSAKWSIVKP